MRLLSANGVQLPQRFFILLLSLCHINVKKKIEKPVGPLSPLGPFARLPVCPLGPFARLPVGPVCPFARLARLPVGPVCPFPGSTDQPAQPT